MFISISYVYTCFCTIPSDGHTSLNTALVVYLIVLLFHVYNGNFYVPVLT